MNNSATQTAETVAHWEYIIHTSTYTRKKNKSSVRGDKVTDPEQLYIPSSTYGVDPNNNDTQY
jgi:hypothetical protein